jgi:hypothetical protein
MDNCDFATAKCRRNGRSAHLAFLSSAVIAAVSCQPAIKRDLSNIPVGQVGFDDLCGLQSYFDALASKKIAAPALIDSTEVEGSAGNRAQAGGRSRYAFQTDFQRATLRRLLDENWKRLPDELRKADRIDLEVYWAQKAGIRRVATDTDAQVVVGRESWTLPYHVCLSELLFGEPLYQRRRVALSLPDLPPSIFEASRDGGAGTVHSDGGAQDASQGEVPRAAHPLDAGDPRNQATPLAR